MKPAGSGNTCQTTVTLLSGIIAGPTSKLHLAGISQGQISRANRHFNERTSVAAFQEAREEVFTLKSSLC